MTLTQPNDSQSAARGKPVVLFVDDEEGVLAGLRIAMRPLRDHYRFMFAASGHEAAALLADSPVDVIVTDLRMPQTNGLDLLQLVAERYPTTVRCVLSGEATLEIVVSAAEVAHQWISKPCDREALAETLANAVRHLHLLHDSNVLEALGGTTSLPTPPRLYSEFQRLLTAPDVPIDDVVALVQSDPAIATKVYQWANSAFSGAGAISDLRSAVVRVGLSALSQMSLLADVFRALDEGTALPGLNPSALVDHVGTVSTLAGHLAVDEVADLARLGGLLCSVGLLLEADALPDRLDKAYRLADADGITLVAAESALYDISHPMLGAYLLGVWGLPSDLVEVVAQSHGLPAATQGPAATAIEAVQRARLVGQRLPAGARLGQPHRDRCSPELENAIDAWSASLPLQTPYH